MVLALNEVKPVVDDVWANNLRNKHLKMMKSFTAIN